MANAHDIQTSFTGGELSPLLDGRVDIAAYKVGCRSLRNFQLLSFGGARRRRGTSFRAAAKNATKRARLVPFVFSQSQAYVLEFGDGYIRVYKDGAQVGPGYEIASPYTEAEVSEFDYSQSADTMIITHRARYPRRLRRFGDQLWILDLVPFTQMPMDERGKRPTDALTLSATSGAITLTLGGAAAGSGFSAADVGRELVAGVGRATITAVASETSASATVIVAFDATSYAAGQHRLLDSPRSTLTPSAKDPVGASITLTADINTWRSSNVGNIVRINGGIVRVESVSSETVANCIITQALNATTLSPPDTWVLESPIWNEYDGFPTCSTFHEQRLLFAGAPGDPQQIAGSQSGAYFDFTPGTLDTDAWVRTIATDEQNAIEYLCADTVLMALTYGGEFTLRGGIEKPITPTNIQVKPKTNYGARRVRPVKVQKERVFVQRSGTQLVAIQYAEENDTFGAEDISILSEHLFDVGVVELAYQRRPVPSLYAVLESGGIAVGTIDRNQNILGWAPWETDGVVESVCAIPRGKTDEVWLLVRRTVNGSTVRYVERLEETFEALYGQTGYPYGYTVDCAIEKSSATPFTVITGLGHLEGEEVAVLADGYNAGRYTVASAQITLATAAKKALAGLAFSALLEPMPPEMPTGAGSARGRQVRATEATILVHKSLGGKINGVPLPTRSFGDNVLDTPPPLVTGERRVDGLSGWARGEPLVSVEADDPLPMHVLAIVQKLVVNP